jgi:hypothetical protein
MRRTFFKSPVRKAWVTLTALTITGALSVIVLYFVADHANRRDNGFIRLFPPHPVLPDKVLPVPYNSYYIAGHAADTVYLGNITAPFHLLAVPTTLADTQHIKLRLQYPLETLKRITVEIDSPYFYMLDGIAPALFRGNIYDWRAGKFMYDSAYFTEAVPLGSSSFVIRSVMANREYALGKERSTAQHVQFDTTILQKQIDGLFCTDGMLQYNKARHELVYLYHYRNEYIRMDTTLQVLERGHTIDTTTHAQIKVGSYAKGSTITLASPPMTVNHGGVPAGPYLFVQSGLRASNESEEMFNLGAVIDVYDLTQKDRERYRFSFYLSHQGNEKVKSFRVYGRTLYALYDHYLMSYTLNDRFFPPGRL